MIFKKININSVTLTNLVFAFFPISFIFGNFIINLNILIFCCLGIFHLKSKIFKINYDFPIKVILLFFFIVLFSTSLSFIRHLYIDGYEYNHLIRLIKSITFFRFFLILLITYFLFSLNILDFKYFIILAALSPIVVSIDIIFQYVFGFNLIGLESFHSKNPFIPVGRYISGFFGDELIAGSYIKNFAFFSIIFLTFKLKNKNFTRFILTTLAIFILAAAILLSGNRMPFVLFMLGLFAIFFFGGHLKKIILAGLISIIVIIYFMYSYDITKKDQFLRFWGAIRNNVVYLHNNLTNNEKKNKTEIEIKEENEVPVGDFDSFWRIQHGKMSFAQEERELVFTALDLWEKNKIFGNGIKSFRIDCGKLLAYRTNRQCSNHPHNYFLEVLVETGLAGFFILSFIGLLFIIFVLKNFRLLSINSKEHLILLGAVISLFIEAFPFRSSGSIFTTHNATYFMLVASIILSYKKLLISRDTKTKPA